MVRKTGRPRTLKDLRGEGVSGNKDGVAVAVVSSSRKGLDMVGIERYIDEKGVLKDAMRAVVDERKLREYALNMDSEKGRGKAVRIKNNLGYTADDFEELKQQVLENVAKYKAEYRRSSEYGESFTVFMPALGKQGQKDILKTGWIIPPGESAPRLTTVFVAKTKDKKKYKHLLDDLA